jgi:hypothetical protein
MTSIKETLISKLTEEDKVKPRSVQTRVGPSEIGGCTRKMWYKIQGAEYTNHDTLRLAAIMGTALHSMIEDVFKDDDRYLIETEVESDGIMGHIDLIDTETNTIWDWKTTTKGSLPWVGSQQQKDQIQLYGYLANKNGIKITNVGLVAIARDGNENDIIEKVYPYNESIALAAIAKYQKTVAMTEPPAPEKSASFCESYCQYFGACPGIVDKSKENPIDNDEVQFLVENYKALSAEAKTIKERMDFLKAQLTGTNGYTKDGTVISWSYVSGRETPDMDKIQQLLGDTPIPTKKGNGYEKLTVK